MHTRQAQPALPAAFALSALALSACGGGDDGLRYDSGADAAPDAPPPGDSGRPVVVAPAAPPVLSPCPDGWRVVGVEGGPEFCDPWPVDGPPICAGSEGPLPGVPGCTRFGSECPADGWPEGLPVDATVLHVRAGAIGGDGTRALPFAMPSDALTAAPDGAILAISPGTYDAGLVLTRPVTLWGACPEAILTADTTTSAIRVATEGAAIVNLRVDGSLVGVSMNAGSFDLREVLITGARRAGINASNGDVVIDGLLVRDVSGGPALSINGATASVRRVSVERAQDGLVTGALASIAVEDSVALDSFGGSTSTAIFAAGGADLSLRRVTLRGGTTTTFAFGGQLLLEDVVIEGEPMDEVSPPPGVVGLEGSHFGLRRVRLDRVRFTGLGILDPGSALDASDVLMRDVVPDPMDGGGHGLEVGLGATAVVDRLWIEGTHGIAVLAADAASTLTVRDLTVRGTMADRFGTFGRALQVQEGASVIGARLALSDSREATVVVAGDGAEATLVDLNVQRTAARACAEMGCPGAGVGIGTYVGGHVDVERFVVTDAALAGVQVAREASMDLRDGLIADNPVGANVQVPGFDVNRLTDRVAYERNGVNLDATELPTPGATTTVGGP